VTYRLRALAEALRVELHSPGVCLACLTFVTAALASGDDRRINRAVTYIAPTLWNEGLDEPMRIALAHAARDGLPDATSAQREFEERGSRSTIFRAVIRHLADDLDEQMRREFAASLN
jgi:hypothetical protein